MCQINGGQSLLDVSYKNTLIFAIINGLAKESMWSCEPLFGSINSFGILTSLTN